MEIKAVIFDYGNVLTHPQSSEYINKMLKILNVDFEIFDKAYYQHRDLYDGGKVTGIEYWQLVSQSLNAQILNKEFLKNLVDIDLDSWYFQNEQMWDLVLNLKKNYKTALLSNNLDDLVIRIERDIELNKYFDAVVFSNKVSYLKPDKRIYEYCLNLLGLRANETIFIDDREVNIEGANKLGINSILFKNYDQLLVELNKYGVILN